MSSPQQLKDFTLFLQSKSRLSRVKQQNRNLCFKYLIVWVFAKKMDRVGRCGKSAISYYWIIGSFRLKNPLRSSSPTVKPALPCSPTNLVPKCHFYTSFEHLQGRWCHHFPGQLFPCLTTFAVRKFFSNIQPKIMQLSVFKIMGIEHPFLKCWLISDAWQISHRGILSVVICSDLHELTWNKTALLLTRSTNIY